MHFTTIAASAVAVLASAASAAKTQMQINYYSDQCKNYVGDVKVSWATSLYGKKENCYNYNYGSFVNIANCYANSCLCNFYYQKDCKGGATQQLSGNHNCVGGAQQLQSFACYTT